MSRILVLYGTTDGHTGQVARALAEGIRECGAEADVHKVDYRGDGPSPAEYDGVVVAASLHVGGFQHGVLHWLRANREELQRRPGAFVAVCLAVLQREPEVQAELKAIIDRFLGRAGWVPELRQAVAGALPFTRYGWLKRLVMRRIARRAGMETDTSRDYVFTDWDGLRQFAHRCSDAMSVTAGRV